MALDNYSALKTSVANWLNREDLTAQIPDFISMAEARFNRELRVNAMLRRFSATVSTGYIELPTDWLSHVSVVVTSNDPSQGEMTYISNSAYNDMRSRGLGAPTRYYTIVDDNIAMLPAPTSSIPLEIIYYSRIPALSDSNVSNWLLAQSPDLYLYGSLIAAEAFLQNDERIPLWAAAADKIINDMKMESERAKRPQGALAAVRRTFG